VAIDLYSEAPLEYGRDSCRGLVTYVRGVPNPKPKTQNPKPENPATGHLGARALVERLAEYTL
jgi:hypothetical protein